jgi:hypothetical protein
MSKKPDPGASLAPAEAKAARLTAWKRETKKADREKAKSERVTDWEEATGLKHEEPTWA